MFQDDLKKDFMWKVPGTKVGDKYFEVPFSDLPANFDFNS